MGSEDAGVFERQSHTLRFQHGSAVRFHTETLKLHPASGEMPAGRRGSMAIGLELGGVSIEDAVGRLAAKGVKFQGPVNDQGKAGKFAGFEDPDGNPLYLAELNWSHVKQGEGEYQHA